MKRICIECGEEFAGRSDKKFCSDGCRNSYNNNLNSNENNLVRNTNNILRKNRRILKDLIKDSTTKTIDPTLLSSKGFNFNNITEFIKTKAGKLYFFCYEYGYLKLDTNKLLIVKKQ